ncbi:MAG: hypothetical protein LW807_05645 [Proteobacteria bacterium]|jgi:hypothetical protein|nr:hypothetical protein [Pseudomonadota bacterium]
MFNLMRNWVLQVMNIRLCILCLSLVANIFADNKVNPLFVCQLLGKSLIRQCVLSASDDKYCTSLHISYLSCIKSLDDHNRGILYNSKDDNYRGNIYSPCGYEISQLILSGYGYCSK